MVNIKQRRKMLGLTQQELAARVGVNKSIIVSAEVGRRIRTDLAQLIADYFGCTIPQLGCQVRYIKNPYPGEREHITSARHIHTRGARSEPSLPAERVDLKDVANVNVDDKLVRKVGSAGFKHKFLMTVEAVYPTFFVCRAEYGYRECFGYHAFLTEHSEIRRYRDGEHL